MAHVGVRGSTSEWPVIRSATSIFCSGLRIKFQAFKQIAKP